MGMMSNEYNPMSADNVRKGVSPCIFLRLRDVHGDEDAEEEDRAEGGVYKKEDPSQRLLLEVVKVEVAQNYAVRRREGLRR